MDGQEEVSTKKVVQSNTASLYGMVASKHSSGHEGGGEYTMLSPSLVMMNQPLAESKLSSLIESPMPPVTDPKHLGKVPGVVKDFSRQYLSNKEGMWPGKIPPS